MTEYNAKLITKLIAKRRVKVFVRLFVKLLMNLLTKLLVNLLKNLPKSLFANFLKNLLLNFFEKLPRTWSWINLQIIKNSWFIPAYLHRSDKIDIWKKKPHLAKPIGSKYSSIPTNLLNVRVDGRPN